MKCEAAIGIMQVLEAEEINVDMVVGCSGGAVFGAEIIIANVPNFKRASGSAM